jgi:hypothetical protein
MKRWPQTHCTGFPTALSGALSRFEQFGQEIVIIVGPVFLQSPRMPDQFADFKA